MQKNFSPSRDSRPSFAPVVFVSTITFIFVLLVLVLRATMTILRGGARSLKKNRRAPGRSRRGVPHIEERLCVRRTTFYRLPCARAPDVISDQCRAGTWLASKADLSTESLPPSMQSTFTG